MNDTVYSGYIKLAYIEIPLISKFNLQAAGLNVNTKDDRLYRNLDISKYSSRSPELRYNRIILYVRIKDKAEVTSRSADLDDIIAES